MADYTTPERGCAALLTVDAQRDYARPDSPVCTHGCRDAVVAMGRLARAFRAQGLPIVHMVRLYRPDGSNVDVCRREAVEEGMRVLMPGSLGAELVDELAAEAGQRLDPHRLLDGAPQDLGPGEQALYKPRWGAFYETGLERRLGQLDISTLVVCGCNFMSSVRATVLEASERDYRVVLITDAVGGAREEALAELARLGVHLMTAGHCTAWLEGRKAAGCAA